MTTNDLNPMPTPSPDAVPPPPPPPAPAPTEEAALAATGEGVPAAAGETPPPEPPPAATEAPEPAPEQPEAPEAAAEEAPKEPEPPSNKHWYVVKVQSGREESIREAIERRVKIEGLEEFFGQIYIPVEKIVEMRNGKRVTRERKQFPGYLMAEVEYNDRILYLFRETSGVGDFVGASVTRAPTPMTPAEVTRMMRGKAGAAGAEEVKEVHGKPPVDRGDRVKVKDGTFAGMEGEVKEVIEAKSQVRVELVIFGRPVPVDLEYWQVEPV